MNIKDVMCTDLSDFNKVYEPKMCVISKWFFIGKKKKNRKFIFILQGVHYCTSNFFAENVTHSVKSDLNDQPSTG